MCVFFFVFAKIKTGEAEITWPTIFELLGLHQSIGRRKNQNRQFIVAFVWIPKSEFKKIKNGLKQIHLQRFGNNDEYTRVELTVL